MRDRLLIGAGLVCGLLIAMVIIRFGLQDASQPTPPNPIAADNPASADPDDQPLSPNGTAIESIVWIEVLDENGDTLGYGSGVVIGLDRVLTAWHVIDTAHAATITLKCCDTSPALGLVAVDVQQDLAVLAVDLPDDHAVPVPIAPMVPADGELATVSMVMPQLGVAFSTKPVLSVREWPGDGLRLRSPVPSLAGSSGSPVLNDEGQLVAIIHGNGGAETTSSAVATSDVLPAEFDLIPLSEYATRSIDDDTRAKRLWRQAAQFGRNNDFASEKPLVEQVVALNPNHWKGWLNLGICIDMLGDPAGAIAPIQRSIDIEPSYGESRYSLGLVHLKLGHRDEAITSFLKAIELDPFYNKPHGMLAVAYYQTNQLDAAITQGWRAVELDPDAPEHTLNLSTFLEESGQVAEAADLLERFTDNNSGFAHHLKRLGGLCLDLREARRAESAYRRAHEINPTDTGAVAGLAISLAAQRRYDEAEQIVNTFEENAPGRSDLSQIRAMIKKMRSDFPPSGGG
jgi:tetratricopeptide (TPR) repeat protein